MARIEPGILIVDATFLRHLAGAASAERLSAACRGANLRVYPSVINAIEALKHTNPEVRERLLRAVETWQEDVPLLPWPPKLLRLSAEAAVRGERTFIIRESQLDRLVTRRSQLDADFQKATAFAGRLEARFSELHRAVRKDVQGVVKALGLRKAWPTAKEFLDQEWRKPDNLAHFVGVLWEALKLGGMPPTEMLLQVEPWRLAMDAFGVAVYQRVARPEEQRNPAGQLDLLQLVYLSAHTRSRIFVTDDKSLHEAASAVLTDAYANARVVKATHLLAT